jgi:hypothetical protein
MGAERPASERPASSDAEPVTDSTQQSDFIVQDYLRREYASGNASVIRVSGWYMATDAYLTDKYL